MDGGDAVEDSCFVEEVGQESRLAWLSLPPLILMT
jgi:hypothetical protein